MSHDIEEITKFINNAGIDPLDFMNSIPPYYFSHTDIEEVHIPDHIKKIDKSAFVESAVLRDVYIPQSVNSIGTRDFYD